VERESHQPEFDLTIRHRQNGKPSDRVATSTAQCRPQARHWDESAGAYQGKTETRCHRTHDQTRTITRAGQELLPRPACQVCRLKIQTSSGRINKSRFNTGRNPASIAAPSKALPMAGNRTSSASAVPCCNAPNPQALAYIHCKVSRNGMAPDSPIARRSFPASPCRRFTSLARTKAGLTLTSIS